MLALARKGRIDIVSPDVGSTRKIVLGEGAYVRTPSWSPDGKRLFLAAAA
jgi:Tol biopolymer transport system component